MCSRTARTCGSNGDVHVIQCQVGALEIAGQSRDCVTVEVQSGDSRRSDGSRGAGDNHAHRSSFCGLWVMLTDIAKSS